MSLKCFKHVWHSHGFEFTDTVEDFNSMSKKQVVKRHSTALRQHFCVAPLFLQSFFSHRGGGNTQHADAAGIFLQEVTENTSKVAWEISSEAASSDVAVLQCMISWSNGAGMVLFFPKTQQILWMCWWCQVMQIGSAGAIIAWGNDITPHHFLALLPGWILN